MSEFKQLILKGIAWSAGAQIGKQAVGFFITMILMRLLSPSDFGLMGMVTVFTGFAWLFSTLGFGDALIQSQVVEERHYSSVFWLNILISMILMGIFLLTAPAIAQFYKEPRLVPLILICSVIFPIGSLSGVQHSILTKKFEFKKIGIIETFSMIVAGAAAILIAYSGYGVYALVWQIFIHTSLRVIIMWIVSAWTPRLIFDFKAIKDLMGFSLNLFGLQIFNYWVRNADSLLIGKLYRFFRLRHIFARLFSYAPAGRSSQPCFGASYVLSTFQNSGRQKAYKINLSSRHLFHRTNIFPLDVRFGRGVQRVYISFIRTQVGKLQFRFCRYCASWDYSNPLPAQPGGFIILREKPICISNGVSSAGS